MNFAIKVLSATFNIFVLLTVTLISTTHNERILTCPFQQCSSERTTMLCHTYIAYGVFAVLSLSSYSYFVYSSLSLSQILPTNPFPFHFTFPPVCLFHNLTQLTP